MSPEYRQTLRKSQVMARSNVRNRHPLRLVSLVLALLSICLAISIIGTAADAYSTYRTQLKAMNPWWLPLWPGHFDIGGPKSLIGASVGVVFLNAGFMALCLVPKLNFHAESFRAMLSAVMLSTASSLLALGSVVYSAILNRSERNRETIQTWTCRFDSGLPLPTEFDSIDSKLTNESFSKLCTESKFAFWTMVTVVILQALLFGVTIAQWVMSFWQRTTSNFDDERPDTGTEMESQKDLKISEEFPKQNY